MQVVVRGEPYELDRITLGEVAAIERVTGKTWKELQDTESVLATLALVYIAMKRQQPSLKFTDVYEIAAEDVEVVLPEGETDDEVPPPALDDATDTPTD